MERFSVQLLSIVLLLFMFGSMSCKENGIQEKPNILFLFADDWGRYASIYDSIDGGNTINSFIETPNTDGIAEDGVVFRNAFVPAPSCTPCRSSILSGQYFYRTGMGAILHGARWDSTIPTYPLLLEESGYHIGYTYKVWSPGTPINAPYGGEATRYENAGTHFNSFSQYVSGQPDREQAIVDLMDEVRGNFRDFLNEREEDQPFCYWFGPTNTHRAWTRGSGKSIWNMDPERLKGKLPSFLPDVEEIREDFNDYLGEVLAWDMGVGVILDELEMSGLHENTVIVISGDHGIPGFPRAKTNLYYLGTHVALIIKYPERFKGNRVVDDFVNLMDLAPTFLELGGVEIPEVMNGKSLVPILTSEKAGIVNKNNDFVLSGWERHVCTAREGNLPYPERSVRTEDYLYIRNFKPDRWPIGTIEEGLRDIDGGPTKKWFIMNWNNPDYSWEWELAFGKRPYEELYKLKEDPYETNNLASDPAYAEIRERLAGTLDSVLIRTEDPRITGDNCIFEQMPYTSVPDHEKERHEDISRTIRNLANIDEDN